MWGDTRSQDSPIVATAAAADLGRVSTRRQKKITLAIIDTAPHAAPDATRIVRAVDLVAIPCRLTAFDIAAAGSAVDIVKAAGVRAVFVLSACPFRSPEIAETRAVLAEYGFRLRRLKLSTGGHLPAPLPLAALSPNLKATVRLLAKSGFYGIG